MQDEKMCFPPFTRNTSMDVWIVENASGAEKKSFFWRPEAPTLTLSSHLVSTDNNNKSKTGIYSPAN